MIDLIKSASIIWIPYLFVGFLKDSLFKKELTKTKKKIFEYLFFLLIVISIIIFITIGGSKTTGLVNESDLVTFFYTFGAFIVSFIYLFILVFGINFEIKLITLRVLGIFVSLYLLFLFVNNL